MKKINILKTIIVMTMLLFNNIKCQSSQNLEYQNDNLIQNIGIGLVQFVKTNETIPLYEDQLFTKVKASPAKLGKDIIPLLNKPDYGILFFTCVEKNPKYYKIATDKNRYAYLKPSKNLVFYSWADFLTQQVTSIENKDKKNKPRASINGKVIDSINWKSDDEIEIIKVQNNWIQIKNITQNNQIFWIEWKNDKELKIYLNLLI